MMKKVKIILGIGISVFALLQFYRPEIPMPPVTKDFDGPKEIKQILRESCYDCHSNETQLKWFDQINPAYTLVREHVIKGRSFLNFSHWDSVNQNQRRILLFDALNTVKTFGTMPIHEYVLLHPRAELTPGKIALLEKYILSLDTGVPYDSTRKHITQDQKNNESGKVKATNAPNGIEFIPDYKNWRVISTSERFDHNSIRIIYANETAARAIDQGKNIPYPDGAILAKGVWERAADESGNALPGKFIHVEFMIKDSKKYASTKGWGWARWLGKDLKPFGKTKTFDNQCISCHSPVRKTDFTFTMPFRVTP
ncbi:MAG: cytochrome P460 family protein [Bacteroidota bacterium]|jgi:hypothetical protein